MEALLVAERYSPTCRSTGSPDALLAAERDSPIFGSADVSESLLVAERDSPTVEGLGSLLPFYSRSPSRRRASPFSSSAENQEETRRSLMIDSEAEGGYSSESCRRCGRCSFRGSWPLDIDVDDWSNDTAPREPPCAQPLFWVQSISRWRRAQAAIGAVALLVVVAIGSTGSFQAVSDRRGGSSAALAKILARSVGRAFGMSQPSRASEWPDSRLVVVPSGSVSRTSLAENADVSPEEASRSDTFCHTAVEPETCWHHVRWAIEHGIWEHPEWYEGLTQKSSFKEFQAQLHAFGHGQCLRPCTWADADDVHYRFELGAYREDDGREATTSPEPTPTPAPTPAPTPKVRTTTTPSVESAGKTTFFHMSPIAAPSTWPAGSWLPGTSTTVPPTPAPTPAPIAVPAEPTPPWRSCRDATYGDQCWKAIIWAKGDGFGKPPHWYNVSFTTGISDVQTQLHHAQLGECEAPCAPTWSEVKISAERMLSRSAGAGARAFGESTSLMDRLFLLRRASSTTRLRVESSAICAPSAPVPSMEASGPFWNVTEERNQHCLRTFAAFTNRNHRNETGRNWCWVAMKEYGCHRHFYDHLTWLEGRALATRYNPMFGGNTPFHPLGHPEICDVRSQGQGGGWNQEQRVLARRWFERNVAVYVLTLDGVESEKRRRTIAARMQDLELNFTFVSGLDLRHAHAYESARDEGIVLKSFNITRAQEQATRSRNGMEGDGSIAGTVGCAAGHFRVQQHALQRTPGRPITVVFEDDVAPQGDFVARLWNLALAELPCDWQAVSLSSRCPYGQCISPHLTRVRPDVNEPEWRCRHGVNYGFQGMVYRTETLLAIQRKWMEVVFDDSRPHCLDVDVALASISDEVAFYAVPAMQDPGFLAELHEGSSRMKINSLKPRVEWSDRVP